MSEVLFSHRHQLVWFRSRVVAGEIPMYPADPESQYLSPPLPTFRFGMPAFAVFTQPMIPDSSVLGPTDAWLLLNADATRVIGYLTGPLAAKFEAPAPLSRPAPSFMDMPDDLLKGLARASTSFLARGSSADTDRDMLASLADWATPDFMQAASSNVAPDFFGWLAPPSA